MTSFVGVYSSKRCIGICDYRCYGAMPPSQLKEPRRNACQCICAGVNHAMGQTRALKNHERRVGLTPEDLQKFCELRGLDPADLVVIDRLRIQNPEKALRVARAMLQPELRAPDLFVCDEIGA